MSLYEPLAIYLEQLLEGETELTFQEIEDIIGKPLPASARKYPAWWANDPSHCRSCRSCGRGNTSPDWRHSTVDEPRREHLVRFYEIMAKLRDKCRGYRYLEECDGRMEWPERGVAFFFDNRETRTESGRGFRVVSVGTHAISRGSKTTLWKRLSQHKGTAGNNGGNHRASVFRFLIGEALQNQNPGLLCPTWTQESCSMGTKEKQARELPLEKAVSKIIRSMPFLWLEVDDEPSKNSLRAVIKKNTIALLSNAERPLHQRLDLPSPQWLGNFSPNDNVRESGLWNSRHVREEYDPAFLNLLEQLVKQLSPR